MNEVFLYLCYSCDESFELDVVNERIRCPGCLEWNTAFIIKKPSIVEEEYGHLPA